MSTSGGEYLLAGGAAELERLRLQARVWEPEAEAMLDRIGVVPDAQCIDLGCGAMGILGPLSRRVGPSGHIVGVDLDAKQLAGARAFVTEAGLSNVEILELDAYRTGLPAQAFDLVHVRFVFAPVGRDDELLREMLRLVRSGGVIAIQEPDASSWTCLPPRPSWDSAEGGDSGGVRPRRRGFQRRTTPLRDAANRWPQGRLGPGRRASPRGWASLSSPARPVCDLAARADSGRGPHVAV